MRTLPTFGECRAATRERYAGGRNSIIGGMRLHVVRRETKDCENTRFPNVQNICFGDVTTAPFGTNPALKPATESFNPDLTDLDVLAAYNCSAVFGTEAVRLSWAAALASWCAGRLHAACAVTVGWKSSILWNW